MYYPNGILEVMSKTGKNVSIVGVPANAKITRVCVCVCVSLFTPLINLLDSLVFE